MDHTLETVASRAREALGGADVRTGDGPRHELFHAANSICSQKVRVVLAHHRLPYASRLVNLFQGQTYLPAYVRLRMRGCAHFGGALVAYHNGSTAASAGGCDGAVVPTLIDWAMGEVLVDSKRICLSLDGAMPDADRLRPAHLARAIDAELAIVDNVPNYQLLMGRESSADEAAETRTAKASGFSERKVAWCDRYLTEYPDDPVLVSAYSAKRAKELSAANGLFAAEAMQAAYDRAASALDDLERKLAAASGAWLFGAMPTLADLFWGIELLRMRNVGVARFWESGRLPRVERFLAAAEALPTIQSAIVRWPGAMF